MNRREFIAGRQRRMLPGVRKLMLAAVAACAVAGAAVLRSALLSGLRPEIYFFEQPGSDPSSLPSLEGALGPITAA